MPPRSVKMNLRIFGFQRRVWWPKWTPASKSSRMETTATIAPLWLVCTTPAGPCGTGVERRRRRAGDSARVGGTEGLHGSCFRPTRPVEHCREVVGKR